jgi:hypothetical protein
VYLKELKKKKDEDKAAKRKSKGAGSGVVIKSRISPTSAGSVKSRGSFSGAQNVAPFNGRSLDLPEEAMLQQKSQVILAADLDDLLGKGRLT